MSSSDTNPSPAKEGTAPAEVPENTQPRRSSAGSEEEVPIPAGDDVPEDNEEEALEGGEDDGENEEEEASSMQYVAGTGEQPRSSHIPTAPRGTQHHTPPTPMCRRKRRKVQQKSIYVGAEEDEEEYGEVEDEEFAYEEEDFDEGDGAAQLLPDTERIAADVYQTIDQLVQSQEYDEYCGEGEEEYEGEGAEFHPCVRPGKPREADEGEEIDETDADGDANAADDDWDYYYEPCDPAIDGVEEDEEDEDEEEEQEEDEAARIARELELAERAIAEAQQAQKVDSSEMYFEEEEEEEEGEDLFQQGLEEEDELKTLFMGKMQEQQPEVDTLAQIEGVVGLTLSPQTKQFFEINDEEMFQTGHPVHKWLSWKKVKMHIFMNEDQSEFFPFYDTVKYYPDATMLLGSDPRKETGQDYFICLTIEARNSVLNPSKVKKVALDLKKQQEQIWNEMASKTPRKWRGYGSEIEVQEENVIDSRPLLSVQTYRYRQHFGSECKFEDAPRAGNPNFYACFKSEPPETYPFVQTVEVDRAIQVMPQKKDTSTQTGFSFKRNKMVQYSTQAITDANVANIMGSKSMAKFVKRIMPRLDKVLQQNEMVDLLHDDYRNLKCKRGHEMEFSTESMLLQEYQTYSDFKHSKGRTVTCMMFHPVLEDVVVMATAVDLTWERRIDAHSQSLMEPNYVLFWDLRDSGHPQIMLDAPADVFSFMINPSDPHLVCGGCANGQIAFWDLGRTYFELRAKIQDRRNLTTDTKTKRPSFLDKLKDSAESLACPLIPVSGLSNLDLSHKRAVTSVAWIPPHIELGKNGMVYENTLGGRSVQFMSVAGDGTLRLWDIRPQKKPGQADEDDEDATKDVIKVNKWAHLENNQWKHHFKYTMEDNVGGPLFATTIRICEKRPAGKEAKDDIASSISVAAERSTGSSDEHLEDGVGAAPVPKRVGAWVQNLNANTTIFFGTEMGSIGLSDWLRNKEGVVNPDFGNKSVTNIFFQTFHHGAITSITKSPFYPELMLVVGGGTISIWKEACPYPIFLSGGFDVFPWCAMWSNSRPAVFYVGNREGSVSIWDLMDRSNGPVMTQPVTNVRITGIGTPKIAASASKNQYLAVTDSEGVLLVLLLPRFYARPLPNEGYVMTELMNREDNRMTSWMKEMEARGEKIQSVNYSWQQSRITKTAEETNREEIEQERRLNEEYLEFLKFQDSIIADLKREEPELPTMDTQISDEFDAMILAAQKIEEEEEEEEDEEEEELPPDDFDFDDFDDDDDDSQDDHD